MNRFVKIIISLSVSLLMLAGGVINTLEPFKDVSDSVSTIGLTSEQRQSVEAVIRESTSTIWFEENIGQFAEGVRYGFRTTFGSMLIYDDHLQIIARQTDEANTLLGTHSVNVLFVDGNNAWQIVPGGGSEVIGTYQQPDGSTLHPEIYKELTLRNVYDGVDLRLYSAEKGTLEFDWLLARAQDYNKIQMQFLGQDGIRFGSDGSVTVDLRYQDLALNIPESYQIINGEKIPVSASMASGDSANVIHYELAGGIVADQPLVIDPTIVWATYFDLNNGTLPFDSYNYAVAVNATGVYIGGWIREDVTNGSFGGYMDVNAGFSQDVLAGQFENYIYRFNGNGTAITAWTSTGIRNDNGGVTNQKIDSATNDAIADMELFPDGRVLVGFASGLIQIYSSNLSSRSYSAEPVTMDTLNAVAPVSNSSFYTSGRVSAAIPAAQIPAVNIGPDTVFAGGSDGVIIRYSNATTTPTPDWATYVGGNGAEYFTAIALTPNGSNLVFTTNTAGGAAFPALVNAVDNTIVGTELLVGVLPEQATVPAAFSVFSYLGGDGDEGTLATDTTAAVVTATDTHFYVAGSTASPAATMPGTAGGGQAANGGGAFDAFVSRIPINGSAGAGFQTTFLGGDAEDRIGGIAYDKAADQLLVFGTTGGGTFPVLDTTPGSDYYDGTFGGGTWDIFVAIFNNTLTTKLFATFIGGTGNDYLGQTGDLIGQGHVTYSSATGLSYLATTVHSTLPANAIGTPPGKDSTKSNGGNDTHTIFAFNINNYDYGDAPLSYDGGSTATAARSAISSTLRIGLTTDVEALPFSGTTALGDDQSNTGSSDDEDGITTINALNVSDTTYSATVSVFNNSGAARTLQGWVDFNLDGAFQVGEYASVAVPSSAVQQSVVLNWAGITVSGTGQRYLRLRLNDGALTDNAGTLGVDERSISSAGTGEVEDYSILPVPQLSKAFSPSTIPTGSSSTLTITIVNPSATSAQTNLAFSDTFPAGMVVANPTGFSISGCGSPTYATPVSGDTSISFTGGGTIAAGGTCTVTVDVTVSSAGAYINDNLTVSSANGAGTTSGAILDANTTSLVMTKTASPVSGTTVNPGDPINYTITITNTGTTTQNNIVVNDVLPAGTTYVAQSTVANGYIVTTSNLTYLDQFGAAAFNNSNGTANWAGTPWTETNDNGVANTGKIQINTATAGVARFDATAQADVLTLTRPVNLTDAIAATLTYTLTETGNNNTTGAGGDYIEVEVYNGTTWTNLTTQNQNFTTFNGNHNVLAYANANTQIRFIVHGYDGGTNDARLDNVQIAYTMQSSPATIKDNIPAGANGDLTGGVPSTLVTTADDFDLLAGQSMTVTYSITVDNPATVTSLDNTALVTSVEQVLPLQSATSHPISAPQADLGLTKTNGVTSVTAGGTTTYSLTVTNSGLGASSGTITVVDVLPTGLSIADGAVTLGGANAANWACTAASNVITCTSTTAIAGAGGTSIFSFPVNVSSTASGTLLNPAQVGGGGDPTNPNPPTSTTAGACTGTNAPTEGCATDSDTVNIVNLGLTKSNGTTTVTAGGTTTYALTVSNSGNTASSGAITVVDVLPTGLTIANGAVTLGGAQAANWTCTAATNVITCTSNTSIAASGNSVFNFTVNVDANASGTLLNPAQVGGGGDPTNPTPPTSTTAGACTGANAPTEGCATDSDTVNVVNLGLAKTNSATTVTAGGTTTYSLTVTNSGNTASSGTITVVDVLPTGMTIANGAVTLGGANAANWTCTAATNVITCTSATAIASGGSSVFSFPVTVSSTASGTLLNPAQVGGGGDPTNPNPPTSTTAGQCTATNTPNEGCAVDSDTVNVVNLGLTKSNGATTVTAGGTTTYTLTVTNSGNTASSGTISVVDVLPTGLTIANGVVTLGGVQAANWTCTAATNVITCTSNTSIAASGGTSVFNFTVNVDANASGTLLNPAQVGGGGDPTNPNPPTSVTAGACTGTSTPTEGCAVDSDTVNVVNLGLTKSNGTTTVTAGGTTTYTLTVSNTGNTASSGTITVVDVLPTGLSIANGSVTLGGTNAANWTCTAASNVITCTSSTVINASSSSVFSFTVNVAANASGTLLNPAQVGGGGDPTNPNPPTNTTAGQCIASNAPNEGCATDSDTVNIVNLGLTKSNGTTTVTAGGTTTYTLTVTNSGNTASSGTITVVDVLPTGLSIADGAVTLGGTNAANWTCTAATNVITCTGATVIAGNGGTSVFSFTVNVAANASGTILNPAQVGGGGDPTNLNPPTSITASQCTATNTPNEGCAVDSDTINVVNLGLTKSNATTTITAGGTTTYTLTVTNSGNTASSGTITVVDVLPTGLSIVNGAVTLGGTNAANWTCTATSNVITCTSTTPIAGSGGTSAFNFTVNVSSTATGTILNPAQVGGGSDPTNPNPPTSVTAGACTGTSTPTEGCAMDSDTVNIVNLGLAKSNSTTTVTAGGTTTYTLIVSNTGNMASSGTITVVDVLPAGLTISNGAVTLGGANAANWTCTAATNVITCTSATAINAANSSVFSFPVNVSSTASGTLLNPAQVGGGGDPTNPTPPTSTTAGQCTATNTPNEGCAVDSDTVNVVNLSLAKSNGTTTITAGGTTTYTLTVTNSGNTASSGTITIVDVLPTGLTIANGAVTLGGTNAANWTCTAASNVITCTSTTAIAGAGGTSIFSFPVNVSSTASGTLLNPAQVGGGGDPTNPNPPTSVTAGACTGTSTPTEGCAADSDTVNIVNLSLTKSNGTTTVTAGGTTTYTLTVSNTGNAASSGTITVVDVLPTGLSIADGAVTLGGANAANWACTAASNVITCTSTTAIAGAGGTSIFSFPVNVSSTASGTLLNPAQVGGGGDPTNPNPPTSTTAGQCTATNTPNEGCAVDSDTVNVVNLGLTKSNGTTTVTAGGTTTYTLTVTNSGNTASNGTITVVDVLPTGLTIANGAVTLGGANAANWTCTAATNVITCTSATAIADSGGTSVFNFTVNVDANASGTLTNPAQVGGGGDPTNPTPPTNTTAGACTGTGTPTEGCATDSDTVNIVNLGLSKSNGATTVTAGGTTTYTLTVSNTGNTASSGTITVVDVLPTGLTIANGAVTLGGANNTDWTCTAATNVITCTSATAINASSNSVFNFTVNVGANASGTLLNPARVGGGGDPTNPTPPTSTTAGACTGTNAPTEGCATDSDTVNIVNLGLTKSNGATTVTAGGTTTYTLTVSNSGNTASNGTITVVDVLPTGLAITNGTVTLGGANNADWTCIAATNVITCTSSTAINASSSSVFSFTINVSSTASGTILNPAQVGGGGDPTNPTPPTSTTAGACTGTGTPTEGCATDSDTVNIVNLGLSKSNGATTVTAGGTTTYTLTVTNSGNTASSGTITVVDVLPTGLTIANGAVTLGGTNSANWTCTAATNVITCTSATAINAANSSVFSFPVNVSSTASGTLLNPAQVGGGGDPTNPTPPTSTTAGACTGTGTPTEGCATDSDTVNIVNLGLTKSNGTTTVTAGGTTTYTLTVSNTGNTASSGTITVVDVLPTGLTIANGAVALGGANNADWTCTAATNVITCTSSTAINASSSSVFSFIVNVAANASGTLTNLAQVGGGGDPTNPTPPTNTTAGACTGTGTPTEGCATDSDTVNVVNLGLTKSNGTTRVTAGGTTTYTLTVTNSGNTASSGTITVVDVLPTGLSIADGVVTLGGTNAANWACTAATNVITCTSNTSIAGSNGASVFSFTVNVAANASGTLLNPAQVGGGGDPTNPNPPTNTTAGQCTASNTPNEGCATDSDTVDIVDLGLAKTNGASTVVVGGTTTYVLTITNSGNTASFGVITVVDVLPTGLTITNGPVTLGGADAANWTCTAATNVITCTSSTPIAGSGGTGVFNFTVNIDLTATGSLVNRTQVGGGGDPTNPNPPTSTTAGQCTATNTPNEGCAVDIDNANAPDLSLSKSNGTNTVTAGGTTTYTLTVTNTGSAATSSTITILDVLPTGLSIADGSVTLSGANSADWICAASGNVITCTSSISISGGGATSVFGFPVNVDATASGTLLNRAQVGGGGDPGNPNPPTTTTTGQCSATDTPNKGCATDSDSTNAVDLGLAKTNGTTSVLTGNPTTYTLTVTNLGNIATTGTVTVVDVLPVGLSVADGVVAVGGTNSVDWTCTAATNVITCTNTAAIAGNNGTSVFNFTVSVDANASGTLVNRAQVGGGGDPTNSTPPTSTTAGTCTGTNAPAEGCATDTDGTTPSASVTGVVFNDADLNGSKAASEAGLVGVIVNLFDSTGTTLIATTTTTTGGVYNFLNLPPGDYRVIEIDPAGYVSSTPNNVPVTVPAGGTGTANFGDYQLPNAVLSSISGVVYNDLDGDGVQDPGEPPLSGVTVDLKNNLGVVIGTVITNASGAYTFSSLPAGSYTVVETDPSGFTSTTLNNVAVTLSAGTSATVNFGDQQPAGNPLIADPAVTKLGSPTNAQVGDAVVYTITVGNNGNTNATNVVLTDTKPSFLDIISVTIVPNPGLTPVINGNTFTINFGTVTPTDFYTITVLTRVNTLGVPPGGVNNASIVTSSNTDRTFNNASAAALTIPDSRTPPTAFAAQAATQLPATGFAPNRITDLPAQPNDRLYAPTNVTLEIPRLGVKVSVVGVPQTDGVWDVAWLGKQAGWLEGSAFPSWNGNSVLTGHVFDANGKPGPFVGLNKLKYGDQVIIRFNGQKYVFEVRTNQSVSPTDTSAFKHEERSWVTLITCKEYDPKTNTYKQRVVVRAVLVSVEADQ